jgi:hypothetical protein
MPWPNVARRVITGSLRCLERYNHKKHPCAYENTAGHLVR